MRLNLTLPVVTATAALLATGCAQPYQAKSLFGLGSSPIAQQAASRKESLALRSVSIAQPCDGEPFTYRYADGRMRADDYAGFVAQPAALLGTSLTQRIAAAGVFQTVVGPQTALNSDFSLVVSVDFLGVEFDAAGNGVGALSGRAWLFKGEVRAGNPVFQWAQRSAVPLTANTPAGVAQSLSAAADAWADALAGALRNGAPSAP